MRKAQAIESANASAQAEAVPTAGYRQRQRYRQRIRSCLRRAHLRLTTYDLSK